jgi:transposase
MDTLHIPEFKKNAKAEGAMIVYGDEASFRQSPTLHQTWSPVNEQPRIPSKGQRNTQKIFGAIELYSGNFLYKHKEDNFNSETYVEFLEEILDHYYKKRHRIYLIQDNASYHKKPETYDWFTENRKFIEVFNLPPYCPELNSTERIWHYTRMQATHNRYYDTKEALCNALFLTFSTIQKYPNLINGLLTPFF